MASSSIFCTAWLCVPCNIPESPSLSAASSPMDDFFADLLPQKQNEDAPKAGSTSNASFQDDVVLPSKLESPKSIVSQSSLDLMSGESQKGHSSSTKQPMGESKMKRELKEHQQVTQAVVENALKRFSGDLQRVLEEISRWACAWRLPGAVLSPLKPKLGNTQASGVGREPNRAAREGCG